MAQLAIEWKTVTEILFGWTALELDDIPDWERTRYIMYDLEGRIRSLEYLVQGKKITGRRNSKLKNTKRKWQVPGSLFGLPIAALADSGSSYDIISERIASELDVDVDQSQSRTLNLPQSGQIRTLGTTTLPFAFSGESKTYSLVFHVVKNCGQQCILGKNFLKKTQTLGKHFTRRVKETVVNSCSRRFGINLIDAPEERLMGTINGQTIGALADTGAEVNIMSRAEAEWLGLKIHDGKEYRATLEFADGSVSDTSGMVLGAEWRFGTDHSSPPHLLDFHILDYLPCGVLLGDEFLYDNQVFSLHEDKFYQERPGDQISDDLAYLFFIILREWKKGRTSGLTPEERNELEQVHRQIRAETALSQSSPSPGVHPPGIPSQSAASPAPPADNNPKRRRWFVRILSRGTHSSGTTSGTPSPPP